MRLPLIQQNGSECDLSSGKLLAYLEDALVWQLSREAAGPAAHQVPQVHLQRDTQHRASQHAHDKQAVQNVKPCSGTPSRHSLHCRQHGPYFSTVQM